MIFKVAKEKNGITLIALVVTIIVLIILAGVSINMLVGENGIITQAQKAKEETEQAKEDELRRLTALEAATNLETKTIIDKSTGKDVPVTIPAGFAVSQVEGENTVKDGLVIIDSEGNEFVWIPVELEEGERFESRYPRTAFKNNEPTSGLSTSFTEPYASGYESEQEEYQAMVDSVTEHKGFYVGRYEAGCATPRTEENKKTSQDVVVKKGAYVYNYVPWGNEMNDTGTTEGHEEIYNGVTGAVELAKNFDTANGYDTNEVTSTLIYGIQWDMMLRYVADEEHNVNDSKSWGNYSNSTGDAATNSGSLNMNYTTGRNEAWKAKNIYDIAGNVVEWTMDSHDTYNRVYRAGACSDTGNNRPASDRHGSLPYYFNDNICFRIALHL